MILVLWNKVQRSNVCNLWNLKISIVQSEFQFAFLLRMEQLRLFVKSHIAVPPGYCSQ